MVTVLEGEAQGLGEPLVRALSGLPLGEAVSRTEAWRRVRRKWWKPGCLRPLARRRRRRWR